MKARVGISSSIAIEASGARYREPRDYVRAVEHFGGTAVVLENDPGKGEAFLDGLDGLLLSGGRDVDVALYGGRKLPSVQKPLRRRDALEIVLVRAARQRGIPFLGICRGLQIANVALGGTLIEDLPSELGERGAAHRHTDHVVAVAPSSMLARIAGRDEFVTNSSHHQAARTLAPELREVAATADGIVEAVEAAWPHRFFCAVQWHPELMLEDPVAQRLFGAFIGACAGA